MPLSDELSDELGKLETEKKALFGALSAWAKEEETQTTPPTTEAWANVRFTEKYYVVKLDVEASQNVRAQLRAVSRVVGIVGWLVFSQPGSSAAVPLPQSQK